MTIALWLLAFLVAWRGRPRPPRRPPAGPSAAQQRAPRTALGWAEVCEAVARDLRSGASLTQALEGPGVGSSFAEVTGAVQRGHTTRGALARWADRIDQHDARLVAGALMFGHEVGGRRAALVDAAAATLRDRHEAMAEVATQATTARLSAIVMAATPVVFGGLEAALDGRTRAALASPVGGIAIAVGLVLDAVGCWWLLRLSRVAGGHR